MAENVRQQQRPGSPGSLPETVLLSDDDRVPFCIADRASGSARIFRHSPLPQIRSEEHDSSDRLIAFRDFAARARQQLVGVHPAQIGDIFHSLSGLPCVGTTAMFNGISARLSEILTSPDFAEINVNCLVETDSELNVLSETTHGYIDFADPVRIRVFAKFNCRIRPRDRRRQFGVGPTPIRAFLTQGLGLAHFEITHLYRHLDTIEGVCYMPLNPGMGSHPDFSELPRLGTDLFERIASGRLYNDSWGWWAILDRLHRHEGLDPDIIEDPLLHHLTEVMDITDIPDEDYLDSFFPEDRQPGYIVRGTTGYNFDPMDGLQAFLDGMKGYTIANCDGYSMCSRETQEHLLDVYLELLERYYVLDGGAGSVHTVDLIRRIMMEPIGDGPIEIELMIIREVGDDLPDDWFYRLDCVFFGLLDPVLQNALLGRTNVFLEGLQGVLDLNDRDAQIRRLRQTTLVAARVHQSIFIHRPIPNVQRSCRRFHRSTPTMVPRLERRYDGYDVVGGHIDQRTVTNIVDRLQSRPAGWDADRPPAFWFHRTTLHREIDLGPILELCGDLALIDVTLHSQQNYWTTHPVMVSIATAIPVSTILTSIKVNRLAVNRRSLGIIISQFPLSASLQKVDLVGQDLNFEEWGILCHAVRNCRPLKVLLLGRNRPNDELSNNQYSVARGVVLLVAIRSNASIYLLTYSSFEITFALHLMVEAVMVLRGVRKRLMLLNAEDTNDQPTMFMDILLQYHAHRDLVFHILREYTFCITRDDHDDDSVETVG